MISALWRQRRQTAESRNDKLLAADPLSDLLLSFAAILILVVIVVLPVAGHRDAGEDTATEDQARRPRPGDKLRDVVETGAYFSVVAKSSGLTIGSDADRRIPLNSILDDTILKQRLDAAIGGNEAVILIIEPDGVESGFVFETLARSIRQGFIQIRLSQPCDQTQTVIVKELCAFERDHGPG